MNDNLLFIQTQLPVVNNGLQEEMLQEDTKNRMDTESYEHKFIQSNKTEREYHAETDMLETGNVQTDGHVCRMHNRIKELMFGRMEGANRRGRSHREWLDDTPGAEPRKNWKSLVDDDIRHLRALSPRCLMMMSCQGCC